MHRKDGNEEKEALRVTLKMQSPLISTRSGCHKHILTLCNYYAMKK